MVGHWSAKYVGKAYLDGEYNCMDLCEDVMKNEFNFTPNLPILRSLREQVREYALPRNEQRRKVSSVVQSYFDSYGNRLRDGERWEEGDFVFMKCGRFFHGGIYCDLDGVGYVLHCTRTSRQVILEKVRDLDRSCFELIGVYKWKGMKFRGVRV